MSDDLISREEALERLQLLKKFNTTEAMQIAIDVAEQQINFCRTAFDKEKVIEELNSERNLMYREDGTLMGARTQISIDRAVDIVEKGGIE